MLLNIKLVTTYCKSTNSRTIIDQTVQQDWFHVANSYIVSCQSGIWYSYQTRLTFFPLSNGLLLCHRSAQVKLIGNIQCLSKFWVLKSSSFSKEVNKENMKTGALIQFLIAYSFELMNIFRKNLKFNFKNWKFVYF